MIKDQIIGEVSDEAAEIIADSSFVLDKILHFWDWILGVIYFVANLSFRNELLHDIMAISLMTSPIQHAHDEVEPKTQITGGEKVDLTRFFKANDFTELSSGIHIGALYLYLVNISRITPVIKERSIKCTLTGIFYAYNDKQYELIVSSGDIACTSPLRELKIDFEVGEISGDILQALAANYGEVQWLS